MTNDVLLFTSLSILMIRGLGVRWYHKQNAYLLFPSTDTVEVMNHIFLPCSLTYPMQSKPL